MMIAAAAVVVMVMLRLLVGVVLLLLLQVRRKRRKGFIRLPPDPPMGHPQVLHRGLHMAYILSNFPTNTVCCHLMVGAEFPRGCRHEMERPLITCPRLCESRSR